MQAKSDLIKRFSTVQRVAHWTFTAAFLALTVTGLFLMTGSLKELGVGGGSRLIHRIAAVIFLLAPVYYLLFDRQGMARLVKDSFTYDKDDLRWLLGFPRYVLGRAKGLPPQGRINAGEKLHHAAIILLFVTVSVSGLFLWLGKGMLGAEMFGWTLIAHDLSMIFMVLLTIGHVYFATVYGALGGMITGYVTRAYARLEHAKWLAELESGETGRRKSA